MWYQKWPEMTPDFRQSVKMYLLQTCGMLLLWEIILWKEIDHFGHLGGFLGGGLIVMGRVDWRFLAVFFAMAACCRCSSGSAARVSRRWGSFLPARSVV